MVATFIGGNFLGVIFLRAIFNGTIFRGGIFSGETFIGGYFHRGQFSGRQFSWSPFILLNILLLKVHQSIFFYGFNYFLFLLIDNCNITIINNICLIFRNYAINRLLLQHGIYFQSLRA